MEPDPKEDLKHVSGPLHWHGGVTVALPHQVAPAGQQCWPVAAPPLNMGYSGPCLAGGSGSVMHADPPSVLPLLAGPLVQIQGAKAFITRRFLPLLEAKKLPYKVEIVHFLTGGGLQL